MKKRIVAVFILSIMLATSGCSAREAVEMGKITIPVPRESMLTVETKETDVQENVTVESEKIVLSETPDENEETVEVYATKYINVREGAGTEYKVLGTLNVGDPVERAEILDNGWSRVVFNGEKAYISSKLLTETKPEAVVGQETTEETVNTEEKTENTAEPTETVSVEVTGNFCTGEAREIFELTNAERVKAGLAPLQWSDELASCAAVRAAECVTTFSHTRPNGTPYNTINPIMAAENLLRNGDHSSPQFIMDAWMASEGHRTNILYPTLGKVGIAILDCDMGRVAVQEYGW